MLYRLSLDDSQCKSHPSFHALLKAETKLFTNTITYANTRLMSQSLSLCDWVTLFPLNGFE